MVELFQAFNLPVIPVNWNNGYWLSADLWDTFDYIKVKISDIPCVITKPLCEVPPVETLLEQFDKIQLEENVPIVLQLNMLTGKRRKELLRANIPFVSPGQIFLPFLDMNLQQRHYNKRMSLNPLSPLSQQLLFLFIYWNNVHFRIDSLVEKFSSDEMTIANAISRLLQLNFVATDRDGDYAIINQSMSRRALYVLAKPYLINPICSVKHVLSDNKTCGLPLAGETALSEYSMLAPPWIKSVAYYGALEDFHDTPDHIERNKQLRVEFWVYPPEILSDKAGVADVLSVVSSLIGYAAKEDDPRLDKALDEALDNALGKE